MNSYVDFFLYYIMLTKVSVRITEYNLSKSHKSIAEEKDDEFG